MPENSRGQNRSSERNKNNGPSTHSHGESRSTKKNTSSRGLRDTNLDRVRNDNRTPKSSGLSEKRNITGSDYDGQLSDE